MSPGCRGGLVFVLVGMLWAAAAAACPFCEQQGKSLTREVAEAKMVVFGTLSNPILKFNPDGSEASTTDLALEEIVKDHEYLKGKKKVTLQRYIPLTNEPVRFLIFADVYKEKLDPYRGIASGGRSLVDYLKGAIALPEKEVPKRLAYFLTYLDNADTEIATDAYREFAGADYQDVAKMVQTADAGALRTRLIKWLKDPDTAPYRFGFYGMLLGLVGKPEDGEVFLNLLEDPDRGLITGMDGVMAGYVRVDREKGWHYVLGQMQAKELPYARRYSALRAVRFLWQYQPDVIDKKELLKGILTLLEQHDLADLAVDDLRKMKVWSHTPMVLAAFTKETHQVPQIRRAILRYGLQCPDDTCKKFIAEQRQKDPKLLEQVEEFLKLELPEQ